MLAIGIVPRVPMPCRRRASLPRVGFLSREGRLTAGFARSAGKLAGRVCMGYPGVRSAIRVSILRSAHGAKRRRQDRASSKNGTIAALGPGDAEPLRRLAP
jgi:hypothetical protein